MGINLQTRIRLPEPLGRRLAYGDELISLGSCFSEHIGAYLAKAGHHISVNPFGAVYNPASIAQALERLNEGRAYQAEELIEFGGLVHSSMHHGAYSALTHGDCLARINEDYLPAVERLKNLKYLLITWGSAWIYEEEATGEVVSNCHKRPSRDFVRRLWSVDELVERVLPVLQGLLSRNTELQIITTISPIRHLGDGAHGNQLSKATLLLMDEKLRQYLGERYVYYPAYEVMLDELRDYRFYAEDMAHPSPTAQTIIAEGFSQWLMTAEATSLSVEVLRLRAQQSHRPLHPEMPEHQLRMEQLELLINSFRERYPQVLL